MKIKTKFQAISFIIFLIVIIMVLVTNLHVHKAHLRGEISSSAAKLNGIDEISIHDFVEVRQLEIIGWSSLESSLFDMVKSEGPGAWVNLQGSSIRITELAIKGGDLQLDIKEGLTEIESTNSTIQMRLAFSDSVTISWGSDESKLQSQSFNPENVALVVLTRKIANNEPFRISLESESFSTADCSIDGISFMSRENGDSDFISSISEGKIKTLVYDSGYTVFESERVKLNPHTINRLSVRQKKDILVTVFDMKVSKASVSSNLFETNLKPTLLNFLIKSQPMNSLWLGVVFLWSILWGTRKLLLSEDSQTTD